MEHQISHTTRNEVLAKQRARYACAGKAHKTKIISDLVEHFGHHRKAAIRARQPGGARRAVRLRAARGA